MPTRGRFVCHVHCLVHDGVVRSSPCRLHHENFGRNLYHMCVPAYLTSQSFVLFWVVVFELLQSQMLIPYLPQMVFSYSDVNTNPSWSSRLFCQSFLTGVLLFKWIRPFQHLQDQVSVLLNGVCFILPKLPLFSRPPSLVFLQRLRFLNQVSFYSREVSPFLFRQCSYPVILRKILMELQVRHSSFFSSLVDSSQVLLIIPFSSFQCFLMPVHLIIIQLLAIYYSGVLKISRRFVFPLYIRSSSFEDVPSFKSFFNRYKSLFQAIVLRCFFWVGPNPQVFSQDLTWLFLFSRSYSQIF